MGTGICTQAKTHQKPVGYPYPHPSLNGTQGPVQCLGNVEKNWTELNYDITTMNYQVEHYCETCTFHRACHPIY